MIILDRDIAPLPNVLLDPIVTAALAEDLGRGGDITSAALIEPLKPAAIAAQAIRHTGRHGRAGPGALSRRC